MRFKTHNTAVSSSSCLQPDLRTRTCCSSASGVSVLSAEILLGGSCRVHGSQSTNISLPTRSFLLSPLLLHTLSPFIIQSSQRFSALRPGRQKNGYHLSEQLPIERQLDFYRTTQFYGRAVQEGKIWQLSQKMPQFCYLPLFSENAVFYSVLLRAGQYIVHYRLSSISVIQWWKKCTLPSLK